MHISQRCMRYDKMDEITLTKQIAKHGEQSVIIIPKVLQKVLKPKTLVELKIKVLNIGDKE